jgi:DNA-binding beta-propeller fold protein YncE
MSARRMTERLTAWAFALTGIVSCGAFARSTSDDRRSQPFPEDIPAARMVADPYPALNGIAVDPENNVVVASDPNRKSLLLYDRSQNKLEGTQTVPMRHIIGPATYIGMVSSVVLDSRRQEIYTANNDIEDTVVVMPYAANGNTKPSRVLSVPHQAWGLALGQTSNELAVTAEIFNAVVFYRREAQGVEAPVRVIRGPKTRLADPHGIYWDDKNGEIGVASHGNFRGVIQNTGSGCSPDRSSAETANETGEFRPPSIAIFSSTSRDDQAPLRTIQGASTKLDWPMGIAEDPVHDTIVVANNGDNSILIFDRKRSGNVAPVRVIRGDHTGINRPMGLAVDAKNGEIWISNFGDHTALAFDSGADGNTAPKRSLRSAPAGTPTPGFGNPMALAYDTKRGEILVPN